MLRKNNGEECIKMDLIVVFELAEIYLNPMIKDNIYYENL